MIALSLLLVFSLSSLLLTGCSKSGKQVNKPVKTKQEQPQPLNQQTKTAAVAVYYLKYTDNDTYLVREVHKVTYTGDLKQAAVTELVKGTPETKDAGKVLPPDTKVNSVKVANGLATVDFNSAVLKANVGSGGEALGIQSIVNTLTEFPGILKVSFTVDGGLSERAKEWWGHVGLSEQPFNSNLSVVWEPDIWVTDPQPGQKISSPVTVKGSARVFEATVSLRLVTAGGAKLVETHTNASAGAPDRGNFEAVLNYQLAEATDGYLDVYWTSPKDGSDQGLVRVPVKFLGK